MNEKLEQLFGSPGFRLDVELSAEEVSQIRSMISQSILNRIDAAYSGATSNPGQYHRLFNLDHEMLFGGKEHRCFSLEFVEKIKAMPFLNQLGFDFFIGATMIGTDRCVEREDVYMRIVRPVQSSDVGDWHADRWFHDMLPQEMREKYYPAEQKTVKLWIPIHCKPGKAGLLLAKDSHKKDWAWSAESGRPELLEPLPKPDVVFPMTPPGKCLLFNDRILHAGVMNFSNETRVSVEITMIPKL